MKQVFAAALAAILAACAGPAVQPGDILQADAFPGAPPGSTATRILYASTAPDGRPVAISGLVIVPSKPAPPSGRPIVAWLHPTTGVATACAPTLGPAPFGQIQGLPEFLAAGYVVVATDYAGLGNPGTHPYLVGASEARAALDSVRAAIRLPGTRAGSRFAAWGHSQGGHAALFTAQFAASYAPELQLVGAAAAAPATNLAALIEQPGRDPLWGGLLSYAVWSWSRVFNADPGGVIPPGGHPTIEATARICLESAAELQQLQTASAPLSSVQVTPDKAWQALLNGNAPSPQRIATPVFLAQGDEDPVIVPALTHEFARRLCQAQTPVRYHAMSGVDHYTAAVRSAAAAAVWIAGRFAGTPPENDCDHLP